MHSTLQTSESVSGKNCSTVPSKPHFLSFFTPIHLRPISSLQPPQLPDKPLLTRNLVYAVLSPHQFIPHFLRYLVHLFFNLKSIPGYTAVKPKQPQ